MSLLMRVVTRMFLVMRGGNKDVSSVEGYSSQDVYSVKGDVSSVEGW